MALEFSFKPAPGGPAGSTASLRNEYDLVVIGAGPAGLTAALYGARAKLSTLVIEKTVVGGLAASTHWIENYPGHPQGITGAHLMREFEAQARHFGAEFVHGQVNRILPEGNTKVIETATAQFRGRAVIVATGTQPKKLGVPGETKFWGRGVSYCATCDGPFFKNKDVVVVGTGSSGLQEGLFLLTFVKRIAFVEFLPAMTGEKILQERIVGNSNVTVHLNHQLLSINGENRVESVTVKNRSGDTEHTLPCQGVFVYVGLVPQTEFLRGAITLDEAGYIAPDERLETPLPGIFAAGDVRQKPVRQIATAVSDGATAAVMAQIYIESRGSG